VSAASNRFDQGPADRGLAARLRAAASAMLGSNRGEPSRLGIEALPDELTRLTPGGLFVVYSRLRGPCEALIWQSAREARTRYVTVVLARTHEETADQLRDLGFAPGLAAPGWPRNLNVLAMPVSVSFRLPADPGIPDEFDVAAQRDAHVPPFARLIGALRALKRFGFRFHALYVIEGADRWFSWNDPVALGREGQWLADWCAARKITCVLLMRPKPGDPAGPDDDAIKFEDRFADDLGGEGRRAFHSACAGVAHLRRAHGELLWQCDFWRVDHTLVTGEVHSLRVTDDGRLTATPETQGAKTASVKLAHDDERVIATRAVVSNEAWRPDEWEVVDNLDAVLAACNGAIAATVLLDYTDGFRLEPLCAAVHGLRRRSGRALKIVVVERGQVLRHQYELLLLSVGANLVVARDLPFSRLQSLLRSLQGQVDTRPIAEDYRASLAASLADAVRGYLPTDAFCSHVLDVLRRCRLLQLPHVLAKLTLLPEVAHVDVLRHCVPRRTGDVFTSDAGHVFVFLFACRMPDAPAALAGIFEAQVTRWSDDVVFLAGETIERETQALAEANRRAPAADFSDLFAEAPTRSPTNAGEEAQVRNEVRAQQFPFAEALPQPSKGLTVTEIEVQLRAVERALASGGHDDNHAHRDELRMAISRSPRDRRHVEPCSMPLRETEEK